MTVSLTPRLLGTARRNGQATASPQPLRDTVHLAGDGVPETRVLAYVERELPPGGVPAYRAARKTGARAIVLWADEHRGRQVARLVTRSAQKGRATYDVLDPHGQVIGTITRRKAFRGGGLRTRWTVSQPGGPEAVGYQGRLFWWGVCWLLSPLIPFLFIGALFENGDLPRAPRRVRWRAGGRTVLENKPSSEAVLLHAPGSDPRTGAALAALLESFKGWYRRSWDDHKE
ncbi:hypothetical protein [Streptomyces sp. MAR4 CNX-425]|uniref:hypothetical protein n=1 Tax=Streptomyces sp. MAR4 CNX-425 TaxID=3406343 RepID=UPI003B506F5D